METGEWAGCPGGAAGGVSKSEVLWDGGTAVTADLPQSLQCYPPRRRDVFVPLMRRKQRLRRPNAAGVRLG